MGEKPSVEEMRSAMERVSSGEVRARWEEGPEDVFAGNVKFVTEDGWTIVVFVDCYDWDYVDSVVSPSGVVVDLWHDQGGSFGCREEYYRVAHYCPSLEQQRSHWGFPGDLREAAK